MCARPSTANRQGTGSQLLALQLFMQIRYKKMAIIAMAVQARGVKMNENKFYMDDSMAAIQSQLIKY
jgi:hypothetical protein